MLMRFVQQPTVLALLLFVTGILVVAMVLIISGPMLMALAVSSMCYAALRPTADALVRRGLSDNAAVAFTMLLMTLMLLTICLLLLPILATQVASLSARMGHLDEQLIHMLDQLADLVVQHTGFHLDAASIASNILANLGEQAAKLGDKLAEWFHHVAFSLVLIPLLVFFLLRDYHQLRNDAMQLLPNRYFELGWLVYNRVAAQLQSYVRGLSIQGIAMMMMCMLGFYLIGVDFAPMLGVSTALLNLIPFFGISLAKIPPLLVVMLSDDPDFITAAMALGVVFFAQTVDAVLLVPRVVARSADLHPLTVMIGVALAGYYFGFFGMILVVPVMFSMKVVFSELRKGLHQLHRHAE